MNALQREGRALGAAFTFMTRLPVGPLASHDPADLPASAAYFPLVGLLVGLLGGAAYLLAQRIWAPPVAVLLSIIVTVRATGAFHEDALADALDGFGGGWSRDQVLAIMKDSRVGSYALVGVVLIIALKFATLTAAASVAAPREIAAVIVAGHTLGRWSSLPLIRWQPYVRPTVPGERPSAGRPFVASVSNVRLVAGSVITLAIIVATLGTSAWIAGLVTIGVTALAARYFSRRIGGITGDALGAANQLVEVAVYLAATARLA